MSRARTAVAVAALVGLGAGCSCFVPVDDQPPAERCDGVDNDHDGLVDLLPDGEYLCVP